MEESVFLCYVGVWGVIMLIYYTEFMLFEIYFMLFRVMSSDSCLILLSACGERFPSPFYSHGDKPRRMSNALTAKPASGPACVRWELQAEAGFRVELFGLECEKCSVSLALCTFTGLPHNPL